MKTRDGKEFYIYKAPESAPWYDHDRITVIGYYEKSSIGAGFIRNESHYNAKTGSYSWDYIHAVSASDISQPFQITNYSCGCFYCASNMEHTVNLHADSIKHSVNDTSVTRNLSG